MLYRKNKKLCPAHPNLGNGIFAVRLNGSVQQKIASVYIYNVLGEEISANRKSSKSPVLIDMSGYPQGIYFVNVVIGDPDSPDNYRGDVFYRKIILQ